MKLLFLLFLAIFAIVNAGTTEKGLTKKVCFSCMEKCATMSRDGMTRVARCADDGTCLCRPQLPLMV